MKAGHVASQALLRPQRGQALVIVALILLVTLGGLGLAVDGGYNYGQRRAMQNAADAAALAGATAVSYNTGSGSYNVLSTVQTVAGQNGVQNPTAASQVTCEFLTDNFVSNGSCTDGAIPSTNGPTTAVRVTVRESHTTFVMRALGISTSSSAATATARVEILADLGVPMFMVCGVNTTVDSAPSNGPYLNPSSTLGGIFMWDGTSRYTSTCSIGPSATEFCKKVTEVSVSSPPGGTSAVINDSAYYYYPNLQPIPYKLWDNPSTVVDESASSTRVEGPTFVIHGPSVVAPCNVDAAKFKGVMKADVQFNLSQYMSVLPTDFPGGNGGLFSPPGNTPYVLNPPPPNATNTVFTNGTVPNVVTSVNGIRGCKAGQGITNCVAFLPIIDNSGLGGSSSSCDGQPGPFYNGGSPGGTVCVAVRRYEAFYISKASVSGNKHTGRMIKGYRAQGAGTTGWNGASGAPLTIRLVR